MLLTVSQCAGLQGAHGAAGQQALRAGLAGLSDLQLQARSHGSQRISCLLSTSRLSLCYFDLWHWISISVLAYTVLCASALGGPNCVKCERQAVANQLFREQLAQVTACSADVAEPEAARAHAGAEHTALAERSAAPASLQRVQSGSEQPPTPPSMQPNGVIRTRSEDFAIECAPACCLRQNDFCMHARLAGLRRLSSILQACCTPESTVLARHDGAAVLSAQPCDRPPPALWAGHGGACGHGGAADGGSAVLRHRGCARGAPAPVAQEPAACRGHWQPAHAAHAAHVPHAPRPEGAQTRTLAWVHATCMPRLLGCPGPACTARSTCAPLHVPCGTCANILVT